MRQNLRKEFIGQHDLVALAWRAVPEPQLANEIEAPLLEYACFCLIIGSEEDRGAKDPLETIDQSAVLLSARLQAEFLQHERCGAENYSFALLLNSERRQQERN